ncbi:MAG: GNAT family N-acetyltransferase [Meiothermus sp.]|nr:GNAT family N-acetyltransferase [Meiothermus sp.]
MSLHIREYSAADMAACLEVFDTNVPKYFSLEEREEFETFLKLPSCVYLVLVSDGKIVGCGGYYLNQERQEAGLCWGLVRRELHGTGLGKRLLLERLARVACHPEAAFIRLDTSQHTFGFFERLGFITEHITPNGYWEGLDRYDMRLELTLERRHTIESVYREVLT